MIRSEVIFLGCSEKHVSKNRPKTDAFTYAVVPLSVDWYLDLPTQEEWEALEKKKKLWYLGLLAPEEWEATEQNQSLWHQGLPTLEKHPEYQEVKAKVDAWVPDTDKFINASLRPAANKIINCPEKVRV